MANTKYQFSLVLVASTLLAHLAFAQDNSFRSVKLAYGICQDP